MKLLKIFGIVAGIHAVALLLIFVNPGCSSSKGHAAASTPAAAPAPKVDPVPAEPSPPAISPVPIVAGPAEPAAEPAPAPGGGAFYSPTRPGTPAAAALEAQPVSDVTPATAYTVGRGDSLWSIAKKNHLKVSVLASANHLRVGSTLRPGQKLVIPGKPPAGHASAAPSMAETRGPGIAAPPPPAAAAAAEPEKHVVRYGETLGTIARHYGIRMGDLATANNISDPQKIRPGQELIIPAGRRSAKGSSKSGAAASAPPAAAPAAIPSANQDLDAGLKSAPPANQVPVIHIQPEPTPAAPAK